MCRDVVSGAYMDRKVPNVKKLLSDPVTWRTKNTEHVIQLVHAAILVT